MVGSASLEPSGRRSIGHCCGASSDRRDEEEEHEAVDDPGAIQQVIVGVDVLAVGAIAADSLSISERGGEDYIWSTP